MCNKVIDVTYVLALGNIMYVNDTVELCQCLYKTKINRLYLINKYFNFTYVVLRRETPIIPDSPFRNGCCSRQLFKASEWHRLA